MMCIISCTDQVYVNYGSVTASDVQACATACGPTELTTDALVSCLLDIPGSGIGTNCGFECFSVF